MTRPCPEICTATIAHGGLGATQHGSPTWPARLEAVVPRPVVQEWCSWEGGCLSGLTVEPVMGATAIEPLQTAKLNGAEPMIWLNYALARIAEQSIIEMKLLMLGALLQSNGLD